MFSVKQFKITWNNFDHSKIELFRDPTWESYIPCEEFIQIYGRLLKTFDGSDMSSYVDFFFRPSPINKTIYEFIDEDARLDFRDMAEEMNLIPSMNEIMEGEDEVEKIKRKEKEKIHPTKEQRPATIKSEHIMKSIKKIIQMLDNETDPVMRQKLDEKLTRTLKLAENTV